MHWHTLDSSVLSIVIRSYIMDLSDLNLCSTVYLEIVCSSLWNHKAYYFCKGFSTTATSFLCSMFNICCLICSTKLYLRTEYKKKKTYSYSDYDCIVYSIQCSGSCSIWAVWQRGLRPVVQEPASWRTASQSPQVLCWCLKLFLWWPLQGLLLPDCFVL